MSTHHIYTNANADERDALYHYAESGLNEVYLANGYNVCKMDDEEYVSIENVDALHDAIGHFLIANRRRLGPKEIRFLRKEMGMTQRELATALQTEEQNVARWEKGKDAGGSAANGSADLLLRLLYINHVLPEDERAAFASDLREALEGLIPEVHSDADRVTFRTMDGRWSDSARCNA